MADPILSNSFTESVTTSQQTSRNNPGVPVNVLKKEIASTSDAMRRLTDALIGADDQQQMATAQAADALLQAGKAGAATSLAQGVQASSKAASDAEARRFLGTDPADKTADVVRFAAERHARWQNMDTLKQEITRSQEVSLLDDPLGFLVNTLRVPLLKREYNQQEAHQDELSKRISTVQQQTAMQQNLDTGVTAKTAQTLADAQAAEKLATSIAQSKEILARSATTHAASLMQQSVLTSKPLEMTLQLAQMTATHSSASVSRTERATESERDPNVAKQKQITLDAINLKLQAGGAKPAQLLSEAEYNQMTPKQRGDLIVNAKIPSFAKDPGESLLWLDEKGLLNAGLLETRPDLAKFIQRARADANSVPTTAILAARADFAKMTPIEQTALKINLAADDTVKKYLTGPERNHAAIPHTSPLAFRPLEAAQLPELKDNWVSQFISQEVQRYPQLLVKPGGVTTNDIATEAVGRALAAQRTGDSGAVKRLSADITRFYREGQMRLFANSGAGELGYPRPTEYAAGGLSANSTGKAIQFWSPIATENWLTQEVMRYGRTARPLMGVQ